MTQAEPGRMVSRRVVVVTIVVPVLVLCVLVAYLFGLLRTNAVAPMEPVAGIEPGLSLYGPGVGDKPLFDAPMAASFGPTDTIYVADTGNNRIRAIDPEKHIRAARSCRVEYPPGGG